MNYNFHSEALEKSKTRKFIYFIVALILLGIVIGVIVAFSNNIASLFNFQQNNQDSSLAQKTQAEHIVAPYVSIIIDNVGINNSIINKLTGLPKAIGFAISPYSDNITKIITEAKAQERNTFINVPMQPLNYHYNDPGPYALLDNLSNTENQDRLKMILALSQGVNGMYFNHREVFTSSIENLYSILPIIEESNLPIVYYDPDGAKQLINSLRKGKIAIKVLKVDLVLDQDLEGKNIRNSFDKLIKKAQLYGGATGAIRPYPISIDILTEYIAKFAELNIELITQDEALKRQIKAVEMEEKS